MGLPASREKKTYARWTFISYTMWWDVFFTNVLWRCKTTGDSEDVGESLLECTGKDISCGVNLEKMCRISVLTYLWDSCMNIAIISFSLPWPFMHTYLIMFSMLLYCNTFSSFLNFLIQSTNGNYSFVCMPKALLRKAISILKFFFKKEG